MDSICADVNDKVGRAIAMSIMVRLTQFHPILSALPEAKDYTFEHLIRDWNLCSEFKIARVTAEPEIGETKTKSTRVRTDRTRKCPVEKGTGRNPEKTCGKNCQVDENCCPEHFRKLNGEEGCQHPLAGGDNRGKPCGKKIFDRQWCKTHHVKY